MLCLYGASNQLKINLNSLLAPAWFCYVGKLNKPFTTAFN